MDRAGQPGNPFSRNPFQPNRCGDYPQRGAYPQQGAIGLHPRFIPQQPMRPYYFAAPHFPPLPGQTPPSQAWGPVRAVHSPSPYDFPPLPGQTPPSQAWGPVRAVHSPSPYDFPPLPGQTPPSQAWGPVPAVYPPHEAWRPPAPVLHYPPHPPHFRPQPGPMHTPRPWGPAYAPPTRPQAPIPAPAFPSDLTPLGRVNFQLTSALTPNSLVCSPPPPLASAVHLIPHLTQLSGTLTECESMLHPCTTAFPVQAPLPLCSSVIANGLALLEHVYTCVNPPLSQPLDASSLDAVAKLKHVLGKIIRIFAHQNGFSEVTFPGGYHFHVISSATDLSQKDARADILLLQATPELLQKPGFRAMFESELLSNGFTPDKIRDKFRNPTLGRGSYGTVVPCFDFGSTDTRGNSTVVALKCTPAVQMGAIEAAGVEGSSAMPVYRGTPTKLVMPLSSGTLFDLISRKPLRLPTAVVACWSMVDATAALHEQKMANLDIKPANMLLMKDATTNLLGVMMSDFGDVVEATTVGILPGRGTSPFMPPGAFRDSSVIHGKATHRMLYALAISMLETIVGIDVTSPFTLGEQLSGQAIPAKFRPAGFPPPPQPPTLFHLTATLQRVRENDPALAEILTLLLPTSDGYHVQLTDQGEPLYTDDTIRRFTELAKRHDYSVHSPDAVAVVRPSPAEPLDTKTTQTRRPHPPKGPPPAVARRRPNTTALPN